MSAVEIRNGGYKNVAHSVRSPTDRIGRPSAARAHCVVNLRFVQMMMIGWHAGWGWLSKVRVDKLTCNLISYSLADCGCTVKQESGKIPSYQIHKHVLSSVQV